MASAAPHSTSFSIAKDGKHHDATFCVEGDVVSVIYWAPEGVTLRRRFADETSDQPEMTAETLLREMI